MTEMKVKKLLEQLQKSLENRFEVSPSPLGMGAAGVVFLLTDRVTGAHKVAKIMWSEAMKDENLKLAFLDEAKKLSLLRHQSLVSVTEYSPDQAPHPYFVMEFLDGMDPVKYITESAKQEPAGKWVWKAKSIFVQLADCLSYIHAPDSSLLHLDIKPANIIVLSGHNKKPLPVLLDFGVARYTKDIKNSGKTRAYGTFEMWPKKYLELIEKLTNPGRTVFLLDRKLINVDLDLHLLGQTLEIILEAGEKADTSPNLEYWGQLEIQEMKELKYLARKLNLDDESIPAFGLANDLTDSIKNISSSRYWSRHLSGGLIRIPGADILSFGTNVRNLVDMDFFQRLRGVKQLGLAHLVYPGATHTRFEHSLGVFENAIQALNCLLGPEGDIRFRSTMTDEEAIATAICALYHDVGHYPFAHQFRYKGQYKGHEQRTLDVIQQDNARKIIVETFNKDVYKALVLLEQLVVANDANDANDDDGKEVPFFSKVPPQYGVLRSLITGTMDADKLDYIKRDSLHAGVPYGLNVDNSRFIHSLRVSWKNGQAQLVLSDKGRVSAEGLIFARYAMMSEVYWHHTVRSYAGMLSAAIEKLSQTHEDLGDHIWDTDNQFLAWLDTCKDGKWFLELLKARTPYRRAMVIHKGGEQQTGSANKRLFLKLEHVLTMDKNKNSYMRQIQEIVASTLGISDFEDTDIVVDIPKQPSNLKSINLLPEGSMEEVQTSKFLDNMTENFDNYARKARIFVHPRLIGSRSVHDLSMKVQDQLSQIYGF